MWNPRYLVEAASQDIWTHTLTTEFSVSASCFEFFLCGGSMTGA
jgi:hypothetical protein